MLYEDFRGTITQVLIAEKKLNIRDENIVVHYKGEVADDERGRLWIKDANQKYYQKESDTLLGDFLVIELEHLGETSMVIRYDLQSLYGAYCSSGWDAVFENVEDKLNMCKSGQEKIKHIANYEKMCDWLVVRPVNYVERKSALQKAIYKRVGDMALVIYILLYVSLSKRDSRELGCIGRGTVGSCNAKYDDGCIAADILPVSYTHLTLPTTPYV